MNHRTSTLPSACSMPRAEGSAQLGDLRLPPPVSRPCPGQLPGGVRLCRPSRTRTLCPCLEGAMAKTPGRESVWRPGRGVHRRERPGGGSDAAAPTRQPHPPSLEAQVVPGGSSLTRAPGGSLALTRPTAGHCGGCTFTPEDRGHVPSPLDMTDRECQAAELAVLVAGRGAPHSPEYEATFSDPRGGQAAPSTHPDQRGTGRGRKGR